MSAILAIADARNATATANSPDWRQAATDLIAFWIGEGRCFSSGEVAAALRGHRPDLRFSVPNLGEFIRDLFYGGSMPPYAEAGALPILPTMLPRFTVGKFPDRTPAEVQVFVYGPDVAACDSHDFEVFIPNPAKNETMADAPAPAPTKPELPRGSVKTPVAIGGAKHPIGDVTATVWPDARLGVPRAAFEMAVHLSGTPIKGGDPVFVTCDVNEAVVTLADAPGAVRYDLWTTQGRIAFANPVKPFVPGTAYKLDITAGKIVVKF